MARNNKFFRQTGLSLGQQVIRMQLEWPEFRKSVRRGEVTWIGKITPTQLSDTYTLRIKYRPPERPVVEVMTPALRSLPNKRIPHRFAGGDLCLHTHGQFAANMFIASTIIGWAALWLFFYETWLVTGEWEGGGEEPKVRKKR